MISVGPSFTRREYHWTQWKAFASSKSLVHQHEEEADLYTIWGYDGPEVILTLIYRGEVPQHVIDAGFTQELNDAAKTEFEATWKPKSNRSIEPRDSDGSALSRGKTTKSGWHYEPRSLDFITSKRASLYNRKQNGNTIDAGTDYADASIKFYDDVGAQLVQGGGESDVDFQTRLTSSCVRTHVDWQPQYDMDIIGGIIMVKDPPTTPAYIWSIVAPDIPAEYGGSVPHMAGGFNLMFFANPGSLELNGRGSKTVLYDPIYNSNKFRAIVKHAAGVQIGIQIIYDHFKA